uniref:Uncharacterized protein n=1 Tax=Wuchereria bancrofti TaxID=6293 RepID=A0A1I8EY40_WUCBA
MLISLTNFAMETILYILSTTIMISFPFMQCLSKRKKKIAQRNDSVKKEYNEKNSDYRTTVESGISATYTVKNQTATEDTRLDTMQDVGNLSRALLDTISILPVIFSEILS